MRVRLKMLNREKILFEIYVLVLAELSERSFFFVYFVDNGLILRVKIKRNFSINGLLISTLKSIYVYTCTYTHETIKSDGKNFTFT